MKTFFSMQFLCSVLCGGFLGWFAIGMIQDDRANQGPLSLNSPNSNTEHPNRFSHSSKQDNPLNLALAIREIESRATPIEQVVATLVLIRELPESDMRRTLEAKHRFPDHSASVLLERFLLARWITFAPEEAMKWSLANNTLTNDTAENWARHDLEGAKRFADSLHSERDYQIIYSAMATTLAKRDIDEAISFILDHPKGGTYSSAFYKLATNDPEALSVQLSRFPPSHSAYYDLARRWASKEPEAAFEWAQSLDRPDLMKQVVRNVSDIDNGLRLVASLPFEDQANAAGWITNLYRIDDLDHGLGTHRRC